MKYLILFLMLFMVNSVEAHECDESKGQLSMLFGTYQFSSIKLCKEVHQFVKNCQDENLKREKLRDKKLPKIDCLQKTLGLMEIHKKEIVRKGDTEFLE